MHCCFYKETYIVRELLFCWEVIAFSALSPVCSQKVAFALASKLLEVYISVTFLYIYIYIYIYIADLLSGKKWQFSGSVNATWCWMDGAQHKAWRIIVKKWKRNTVLLYLYHIELQCVTQMLFPQGTLSNDYMVRISPWHERTKGTRTYTKEVLLYSFKYLSINLSVSGF